MSPQRLFQFIATQMIPTLWLVSFIGACHNPSSANSTNRQSQSSRQLNDNLKLKGYELASRRANGTEPATPKTKPIAPIFCASILNDKGIWPDLNTTACLKSTDTFDIQKQLAVQPPHKDLDKDGIPNRLDLLLGAKKTVLNGAIYNGKYVSIPAKMGDVPRNIGVCTDVVIRALRNAGLDLQTAVQADRKKRPRAYPNITKPKPSIDHRRVKNLAPWFKKNWQPVSSKKLESVQPGDIVLMDTLSNPGPDHIGIVSNTIGPSGYFMIINNWTNGSITAEMDLLPMVPIVAIYRWP